MRAPAIVFALGVVACAHPVPSAPRSDGSWLDAPEELVAPIDICDPSFGGVTRLREQVSCGLPRREVRAFGPVPRERPPAGKCPVKVRLLGDDLVAEPRTVGRMFDPLPFASCIPTKYVVGSRHVMRVDDGWLVAYESPVESEVRWYDDVGRETRLVSHARVAGFVRTRSGALLALAIGRARLGRGAVVVFERPEGLAHRGEWALRIVTPLPIEPAPALAADHGAVVGFAGGFVFRADETGAVENLHYLAHDVGAVSSIVRMPSGAVVLGLECGVLKLEGTTETWWSARDGASGRWRECGASLREAR